MVLFALFLLSLFLFFFCFVFSFFMTFFLVLSHLSLILFLFCWKPPSAGQPSAWTTLRRTEFRSFFPPPATIFILLSESIGQSRNWPKSKLDESQVDHPTPGSSTFDSHCGEEDWCCASWCTFATGIAAPKVVPLLWEAASDSPTCPVVDWLVRTSERIEDPVHLHGTT